MSTIITDKIVSGGDCIGKINGKTIFVSGALPGETVEIKITSQKKDYDKACVTKIIKPSEHRVKPFCPLYGICGGCNLQIADFEYQSTLRKQIMEDLLSRTFYHLNVILPKIEVITGKETEYRNRFQFTEGGLQKKAKNESVKLKDCPVAVPEIRKFLSNKTNQKKIKYGRTYVFADKSIQGDSKVITDLTENTLCTINLQAEGDDQTHNILFDVRGFFQSNLDLLQKTIPYLTEDLAGDHLLDMYAGVGTISVFAGKNFKKVSLVEHNKKALAFAKKNLQHLINNGIEINTFPLSGERWVKTLKPEQSNFDAIIVDPPRSGIEKSVLTWLSTSTVKTIRYMSCNPVTLARDAKVLVQNGYTIERLFMLDFYPQTSHIEALAWFKK
ncbi:MAG: hypothetical protein BKP49_01680 [Treponema sp. CETP13]|nr:MAG: hypothetical protein BKP49_01680 [Treponema sp. CETP13]